MITKKNLAIKPRSTFFLKIVLVMIAVVALGALIWLPLIEGKARDLDVLHVYSDPVIFYTFVASIPFFYGVYQAFALLTLIDANQAFSQQAVMKLKNMKRASLCLIGFILLGLIWLRFLVAPTGEDAAGPLMLGVILSLAFGVIATAASLFEKLFQNAEDLKQENDLTV